ncbi:hypothetical protein [Aliikangiella maris]|uniref:Uncharacterized protein n=2 Tax=Aliikangiella maris TaxID=3162458 RepID=A0ABV3MQC6_9GAMM
MVKYLLVIILSCWLSGVYANDPTRPLIINKPPINQSQSLNTQPSKQLLTAIFYRNNQYFAIIDEKTYQKGDRYRGDKIVSITTHRVTLRSSKGLYSLNLYEKIKKP